MDAAELDRRRNVMYSMLMLMSSTKASPEE
jgi:hypothetical protein